MHTSPTHAETPFSDASLWAKLAGFAKIAGKEVVEKVLTLYYALRDNTTPHWARNIIIGALVYFISPFDAVPDFIPLAGFADDLGALIAALSAVAKYVKPDHAAKARETLGRWFSRSAQ